MRNMRILFAFAAAAALGAFVGCGDPNGNNDAGVGSCTTDATCGTGLACHPATKKCSATCTGGSDCPSSAKTCAPLNGSTKSFCQCSTDALCGGSLICSNTTKQCTSKCTSSASCSNGAMCDTTSGQCLGGNIDAGTDAGVTDAGTACAFGGTSCTNSEICDLTTSHCKPSVVCNSANPQPDTCGYANYCDTSCKQVGKPTCANFTPPNGKTPLFNGTSTGPIIYSIDDGTDIASFCHTTEKAYSFTISAYATTDWPTTKSAVQGFKYVKQDGTELDATSLLGNSSYTATGKIASFKVTLCSSTVMSNLGAAFYFTNGNEVCAIGAVGTQGNVP